MPRRLLFSSGFFFFLVLVIGFTPCFLSGPVGKEAESLYRGLESSGAQLQRVELQGWALLSGPPLSLSAKKQWLARAIATLVPGKDSPFLVTEGGQSFSSLTWEKSEGDGEVVRISLRWSHPGPGEEEKIYLLAGLTRKEDFSSWQEASSRLEQVFSQEGLQPNYSILVVGTLPGIYSYNEQEEVARRIFRILKAVGPIGIKERGLSSFTGYSPLLGGYLRDLARNKINTQVSLRYHPIEDRTYLYLGSPLINGEY
ncbi:MAG TPA: hypothetical protein GX711_04050 [Clostridia bacterium]|nr:hypothetical protein [Clostridia bacterium]